MEYLERENFFLALVGPAGGGKTTFVSRLLAHEAKSLALSVSYTSRTPRPNEVQGASYQFVSREDFLNRVAKGFLYEWEEVHGNLYGTSKSALELGDSKDVLFDIDIRGALKLKADFPHRTVIVFLAPPNSSVLVKRVTERGGSDSVDLERRLSTAKEEYRIVQDLAHKQQIDYFIVNNEINATEQVLLAIIKAERQRLFRIKKNYLSQICN